MLAPHSLCCRTDALADTSLLLKALMKQLIATCLSLRMLPQLRITFKPTYPQVGKQNSAPGSVKNLGRKFPLCAVKKKKKGDSGAKENHSLPETYMSCSGENILFFFFCCLTRGNATDRCLSYRVEDADTRGTF